MPLQAPFPLWYLMALSFPVSLTCWSPGQHEAECWIFEELYFWFHAGMPESCVESSHIWFVGRNTSLENIGRFKEFSSDILLSKLVLSADSYLLCSTKHSGTADIGSCVRFSLKERLLFIAFFYSSYWNNNPWKVNMQKIIHLSGIFFVYFKGL